MATILLSINSPKESVLLKQFLLKSNIHVVTCLATFFSYTKGLQYTPDLVVSEFPEKNTNEYFKFLKAKMSDPMVKPVPFVCYGNENDAQTMASLKEYGVEVYIKRPITPQMIVAILTRIISSRNSSSSTNEQRLAATPEDDVIRILKDRTVLPQDKLLIMRKHITKLLAFPVTVANILRVTQNERSGAGDLAVVMKTDPAVSAEILKAANSVNFSRSGTRISNVKEAIVRIGFMESRKLALSLSVFKLKQNANFTTGFNHIEFWFHSLAVAIIAERLAKTSQLVNPEEAFIGGILHDIGSLLFNEFFNPVYLELLGQSINEKKPFLVCEEQKLGVNHNLLMQTLFTEWNFPQSLIAAVPYFSKPDIFNKEALQKVPLALIITFAEQIARSLGIGADADNFIQPIAPELLQKIKLPYGIQKSTVENVYTSINTFNQVLKIDERSFPQLLPENFMSPDILYCTLTDDLYNPIYDYYLYKQYTIASARAQSDFMEKIKGHDVLILNGISSQHIPLIKKLSKIQVPAPLRNQNPLNDSETPPPAIPLRMILFSQDRTLDPVHVNSDTTVLLSYPVDLRSIDAILSCYENNLSPLDFGKESPPESTVQEQTLKSTSVAILHSDQVYRKRLLRILSGLKDNSFTEADTPEAALEILKDSAIQYKSIFLEFTTAAQIIKHVALLQQISSSKPQCVIIFKKIIKSDILPLISAGITHFISEHEDDEAMAKRIGSILV